MVRIGSGRLKGSEVKFKYRTHKPRPTQGIVKEALFSILNPKIEKSYFLDLFAGSGAVGMEAFSNGAKQVYFVEHNIDLYKSLQLNFKKLELDGTVFYGDYEKAINYFSRKQIKFDIIFIDPPYELLVPENYQKILIALVEKQLLYEDAVVIVERDKKHALDKKMVSSYLELISNKHYGNTYLDIYQTKPPHPKPL